MTLCGYGEVMGGQLYPPIEPYDSGMLDVGDGNHIYWENCGNPRRHPSVDHPRRPRVGSVPGMRRPFNPPKRYRIVAFDQRGCGRSTPHAGDPPTVDLSTNTADHLIADMERLRNHLDIHRWMLVGWSWGTTLALAYAQAHPTSITGLVLTAVTTTSPSDVAWITHDVGRLFPAEWTRFRDGVPDGERHGSLVDQYARLLASPDPGIREKGGSGLVRLGGKPYQSWPPSLSRTRDMPIRDSECASPAWSRITGGTQLGEQRANSSTASAGSSTSRRSSSTAAST